jgi:hypothetical protein
MPELTFQVTGVQPCAQSIAPLLQFKLRVANSSRDEAIHTILLSAQVQIQAPQRSYNPQEKEKLLELFGPPESWGQTLRNRLWTQTNATIGAFSGSVDALLPVACTCDLNLAATKYMRALEGGEVSLLFLFSGSVFYVGSDGRLQVSPISWNSECVYRMPAQVWRDAMERHYPNVEWLCLRRDTFEQLHGYKRRHCLVTWEDTLDRLLSANNPESCAEDIVQRQEALT